MHWETERHRAQAARGVEKRCSLVAQAASFSGPGLFFVTALSFLQALDDLVLLKGPHAKSQL